MPRQILIAISALTITLVAFGLFTTASNPVASEAAQMPQHKPGDTQKTRSLHDCISLMNLLTGLWLDHNQYEKLLPIVEKASTDFCAIQAQMERLATDTMFQANLKSLHSSLLKGEEINKDKKAEIQITSGRINDLRHQAEEITYDTGMQIKDILNENQLYLARVFQPCLFLPEDPNSPTLIGQVRPDGRGLEMLKKLRDMPDWVFNRELNNIIERSVQRMKAHLRNDFDPDTERRRLRKLFTDVRNMSDQEFSMREGEILDELFLLGTAEKEIEYDSYAEGLAPKDRTALKLGNLFTGEGKPEIIRTFLGRS